MLFFSKFSDFRNFQDSTIAFYLFYENWEEPIVLDPRKSNKYSQKKTIFFKNMFDLIGVVYVVQMRDSQKICFSIYEMSKIPPFYSFFQEYPVRS